MPCKGLHCNGCRGGGGVGLVVIVAVVLAIAAAGKAIREAVHVAAVALEVAAIVLVAAAIVAAAVALARVVSRALRRPALQAAAAVPRVTYQAVPVADEPLEIERPRRGLDGATPYLQEHAYETEVNS